MDLKFEGFFCSPQYASIYHCKTIWYQILSILAHCINNSEWINGKPKVKELSVGELVTIFMFF